MIRKWLMTGLAAVLGCGGTANAIEAAGSDAGPVVEAAVDAPIEESAPPDAAPALWQKSTKITRHDAKPGDRLGESVAASDRWVFASSLMRGADGRQRSVVHAFERLNSGTYVRRNTIVIAEASGGLRPSQVAAIAADGDRLWVLERNVREGARLLEFQWTGHRFLWSKDRRLGDDACRVAADRDDVIVTGTVLSVAYSRTSFERSWAVETPTESGACPNVGLGALDVVFAWSANTTSVVVRERSTGAQTLLALSPGARGEVDVVLMGRDIALATLRFGDPVTFLRRTEHGSFDRGHLPSPDRMVADGGSRCESCLIRAMGDRLLLVERDSGRAVALARQGTEWSPAFRLDLGREHIRNLATTSDRIALGEPEADWAGEESGGVTMTDVNWTTATFSNRVILTASDAPGGFGKHVAWQADRLALDTSAVVLFADPQSPMGDPLEIFEGRKIVRGTERVLVLANTYVSVARRQGELWTAPQPLKIDVPPYHPAFATSFDGTHIAVLSPATYSAPTEPDAYVTMHRVTDRSVEQIAKFSIPATPPTAGEVAVSGRVVVARVERELRSFSEQSGTFRADPLFDDALLPITLPRTFALHQGRAVVCGEDASGAPAVVLLQHRDGAFRHEGVLAGERCSRVAVEGDRIALLRPEGETRDGTLVIYERSDGAFRKVAERTSNPTTSPSGFGDQIAIHGNFIAVTAPSDRNGGRLGGGAVYLFER
jgi:hypothetical protein